MDVQLTEEERGELADTFCQEITSQLEARADLEENWMRYLKVYDGRPEVPRKTTPWDGSSNLVVNLAKIYVDQSVARAMQGIFGNEPHWVAEQVRRRDSQAVKPIERYMDWCRQHQWKQKRVVKPFVLECIKLGTGVLYNGWRDEPNMVYDPMQEKPVERGRNVGPAPCWVPREDFLHPSTFCDIQAAPWIAYRPWFTWQDLKRLEKQEVIHNVDDIKANSDEETPLRMARAGLVDFDAVAVPHADAFSLYSPWQVWFRWDLDGDDVPEDYTMLLHVKSKTILRIAHNPYVNGMRPFIVSPFVEIEGQLDGCGIPRAIEHYQSEASTIHNQRVDNGTLANSPVFTALRAAGFSEKLKFRPGAIFLSSTDINGIRQLVVNSGYQRQHTDEQVVIQLAERAIGLSDQNLGQISSPVGRAAATTMMFAMQEGTRRHDFSTAEIRDALSEQGLQILELWQTHGLPEPSDPGSPKQVLDEGEAEIVRGILGTQDNIRGIVALKLNVATQAINKEIAKQTDMQLLGAMQQYFAAIKAELVQSIPMVMQAPPQLQPVMLQMMVRMLTGVDKQMTRVFQDHGSFDLEEFLVADLLVQAIGEISGQGLQGNVAAPPPIGPGAGAGGGAGFPPGGGAALGLPNGAGPAGGFPTA